MNDNNIAGSRRRLVVDFQWLQGGKLELGAPTGKWQLIIVYRGKHCPVSKNYLASLQMIIDELDEMGVEVIAVSGDGRERAESFVSANISQPSLQFLDYQLPPESYTSLAEVYFTWRRSSH